MHPTHEQLELALLILDGFDESAMFQIWGPYWRCAIVGLLHEAHSAQNPHA